MHAYFYGINLLNKEIIRFFIVLYSFTNSPWALISKFRDEPNIYYRVAYLMNSSD